MGIRQMFIQRLPDEKLAEQMGMSVKDFKALCKESENIDCNNIPWHIKYAIDKVREINSKEFPYTLVDYEEDCLRYAEKSRGYLYGDWDTKAQLQNEEFGNCPFDLTWAFKKSDSYIMGIVRDRFVDELKTDFGVAVNELIDDHDDFIRMMRTFRRFF